MSRDPSTPSPRREFLGQLGLAATVIVYRRLGTPIALNDLIPGALLVPSGKFALTRAQNAGCAYMRGT